MSDSLRVALVLGGVGCEHEVSLATGDVVLGGLDRTRYLVKPVRIEKSGEWTWLRGFLAPGEDFGPAGARGWFVPDGARIHRTDVGRAITAFQEDAVEVAFLALHGPGGEDGTVQGLFELAGIPYTGAGVLASALAMDKVRTKEVLASHGVWTAPYAVVRRSEWRADPCGVLQGVLAALGLPIVVKPPALGSSIGITVAADRGSLASRLGELFERERRVLLETFLDGTEITCAVLGGGEDGEPVALPPTEIVPRAASFFDYDAKYTPGASEEITPARIGQDGIARVQELAVRVHRLLDLGGVSRTDMILSNGDLYVLETNTLPGMTRTSLLPQGAAAAGITFEGILDHLLRDALARPLMVRSRVPRETRTRASQTGRVPAAALAPTPAG
ncbi:MAG: D-alanine--D-alanine ligase [Planctomycetes bacterium]|nr:D-alanine--D-alanine ligase [Planctomycetota bacterium]